MTASGDLAARLRALIADGTHAPGERLPTVAELMTTYQLKSRGTLDRALRDLEASGLITVRHGAGIFVRKDAPVTRDLAGGLRLEHRRAMSGDKTSGLFEAMTGVKTGVTCEYAQTPCPVKAARALGLPPWEPVLMRQFRYATAGKPHQITCSYMALATASAAGLTGPGSETPGTGTMAQLHAAGITITRVALTVAARMPDAAETSTLAIRPGTPVFELWRTMYAGDTPAEVSAAVVPADRITYLLNVDLGERE